MMLLAMLWLSWELTLPQIGAFFQPLLPADGLRHDGGSPPSPCIAVL
jgi:hypothetical protein